MTVQRGDRAVARIDRAAVHNPAYRVGLDACCDSGVVDVAPLHRAKLRENLFESVHPPKITFTKTNAITQMTYPSGHHGSMTSRDILSANVKALIDYSREHGGPVQDARSLALKAKLTPPTIGRVLKRSSAARIGTLDAIARVFKIDPWLLLMPGLDPSNPPVIAYTDSERRLYRRLKELAHDLMQPPEIDK